MLAHWARLRAMATAVRVVVLLARLLAPEPPAVAVVAWRVALMVEAMSALERRRSSSNPQLE